LAVSVALAEKVYDVLDLGYLVGGEAGVFFCEFDGPRRDRRVSVTLLGDR